MASVNTQQYFKQVKQFKCGNCGGEINIHRHRSNYIACQYCGAVSDITTDAHKTISKANNPSDYPPMSFIKLGMEGTFDGIKHYVIARTCWKNVYKEYWTEGFESGYSDEVWQFEEWLLVGENNTYFYLVEDENGYSVSKSFTPKFPSVPFGSQITNFNTNAAERCSEYGHSTVEYFEGESTYQIKNGDRIGFASYNDGNASYITEWRIEKNNEIKEIEFFEEIGISEKKLKQAFGLYKNNQPLLEEDIKENKKRKFNRILLFLAAFVFLVLTIVSTTNEKGDFEPINATLTKFNTDMMFNKLENKDAAIDSTQKIYKYVTASPVYIDETYNTLAIDIISKLTQISNAKITFKILDESMKEVKNIEMTLISEDPTSTEALEEKFDNIFKIDKSGNYNFDLQINTFGEGAYSNFDINIKIKEGIFISRYYIAGLVIFLLLAIFTNRRK